MSATINTELLVKITMRLRHDVKALAGSQWNDPEVEDLVRRVIINAGNDFAETGQTFGWLHYNPTFKFTDQRGSRKLIDEGYIVINKHDDSEEMPSYARPLTGNALTIQVTNKLLNYVSTHLQM